MVRKVRKTVAKSAAARFLRKPLGTRASFVVLAVVFVVGLAFGGLFIAPTGFLAAETFTVTSIIMDEAAGPTYGFFQVPSGKVAYDLTGSAKKATGWGIYKATLDGGRPALASLTPVYHTSYGLNRVLQLSSGAYILLVDGSRGANVLVEYKLK